MIKILSLIFLLITLSSSFSSEIEILYLGDSLSLGGFGNEIYTHYTTKYGKDRVAFYSSCGASPESYIKSYRNYYTKCGYRERTPNSNVFKTYVNGKRPPATLTPKVEDLIQKYKPKQIVVQLGTNWMDGFSVSRTDLITKNFIKTLKSAGATITWITPPDSSHYSPRIEEAVKKIIVDNSINNYRYIDSSLLTNYTKKSGGDGIHYNDREGKLWAKAIIPKLENK